MMFGSAPESIETLYCWSWMLTSKKRTGPKIFIEAEVILALYVDVYCLYWLEFCKHVEYNL